MIPEEILPAFERSGASIISTCALDGTPNATVISEVHYVDPTHVALSFQFFNKTIRNVRENPFVCVHVWDMRGPAIWELRLRYDHSETSGPIFDAMDMRLEVLASLQGMVGIFKLRAADVYEVLSVERLERLYEATT